MRSVPLLVLAALALLTSGARAQGVERVRSALLQDVMPEADRFEPAGGDPPVRRAYAGDALVGYVFLTSDVPPEVDGYSGPVSALVGMSPDGVLVGVRVIDYRESRRYDWGDFLSDPWLLDQFPGKHVAERFRVNQDIDGISQVTISVRALARGVRDAARRVALTYGGGERAPDAAVDQAELEAMSWYEMRRRGVAVTLTANQQGRSPLSLSLIHVPTPELGALLVGRMYQNVLAAVERRGGADHVVLYAVDGTGFQPPLREGWSIEQGGRTVAVPAADVVVVGAPGGGLLLEESSQVGALLLDADDVSLEEPLTFAFDRGRPELGTFRVAYSSQAALARAAGAAASGAEEPPPGASAPTAATAAADAPAGSDPLREPQRPAPSVPPAAETSSPAAVASDAAPPRPAPFDFTRLTEDEAADGPWASVAWLRVGWTLLVLALATLAFLTKIPALRWVSLGTTLVVLGWVDGGFLSISHLTGLIWVGPSAILSDLPLLIMATFALATVVLWGRVFCGYLCPFGALQDFLDRLVPARLQRELPERTHRIALKAKYVVLAIIMLPAIAGSQVSLYQYFEPFGTVFFVGRSALLWVIAGSILVAGAVVPRFYCRYACPLGASLALASAVSLRRFPRVEQCAYCKVCEFHCPTGAIHGARLDFAECVRCNECEARLLARSGVCRHDMEAIRPRLVQLRARRHAGAVGGA
jgi:ferredoxin